MQQSEESQLRNRCRKSILSIGGRTVHCSSNSWKIVKVVLPPCTVFSETHFLLRVLYTPRPQPSISSLATLSANEQNVVQLNQYDPKYVQDCWLQCCLGYLVQKVCHAFFFLRSWRYFSVCFFCFCFFFCFLFCSCSLVVPTLPNEKQEIRLYFVLN